jgi:hypothetical protein
MTNQLADNQYVQLKMASGGQKATTEGDQGINALRVLLRVTELLLDGFVDISDPRTLVFGHCDKLVQRPFEVRTLLVSKGFPDVNMHRFN